MGKLNIKSILSGRDPQTIMLEETRKLVGKWQPTGLLDGLKNETEVRGMAVLLENQARQLIRESSRVSGPGTEEWSGVALPLVRRIFGEVAAKEFVSVQPMNLPSGLVFFLDFQYGSGTQPGFKWEGSVYGGETGSNGSAGLFGRTSTAADGLYGPGKFGYSINDVVSGTLVATATTASWADVDYVDGHVSASAASALRLTKLTVTLGPDIDAQGVRAFKIYSASNGDVVYYPEYTSVATSGANYLVSFIVSSSGGVYRGATGTGSLNVFYQKQPVASERGDFEDQSFSGSFASLDIPELDLILKSEPIVAKTRKLKAVWTPELTQDLNAYHSVDAEAELTSMLSEYVAMEIDLEILDMLIQNADTTEYWSAKIGWEFDTVTSTFVNSAVNNQAYVKPTWYQTLGVKIQKVSNKIHQKTLRGGANFMVVSPDVATILESIPGYMVDTDGDKLQFAMGVTKAGSFANRFTVYKNPYMLSNAILLGFKGGSFLESGAVYSPYVPLIMTPVIYDYINFTPRKAVMTRYAKKMIRPEFYGRVLIAHMDSV
ncbi:MAG: hypothetical protein JETCAE03_33570 [Ignavibacteriaceae bacterium]|jgi:hypothetical protein|nr:MAG: hypothetical protein JETCAE03_33570 [Ignavibacteriaceae bacterium]